MHEFLNDENILGERVVQIPPNIEREHWRSEISTHGEGIEKTLAGQLAKHLKGTTLAELTFAIDFKTTVLSSGQVDLLVNPLNNMVLEPGVEQRIRIALSLALEEFNTEQAKQHKPTKYYAGELINVELLK